MANIWDKFDKQIDTAGLQADVKEAKNNTGGDFEDVPHGNYEVKVDQMELVESKKGDPMVKIWFKIVEGKFKNSLIFYYQVITQGFQIHLVNELLRGMDTGMDIEFVSYSQYGTLLMDIMEEVDETLEFELEYSEGKKGFNNYKILDVFEV